MGTSEWVNKFKTRGMILATLSKLRMWRTTHINAIHIFLKHSKTDQVGKGQLS
jgi:hypothetical protein